ncbi:phosphatidylethanolamine-binding protein homolog F40A3.3-like [Aethina tumida]|uniref:phosphatidylethanolamine-binding protein homolog F40A3.3-like n=1 Tax=Aethina tumida TaxID=116153 RepID=UPI00096AE419|nr:phosphatidylethanolamine-binding protein homolog F40A3.3-like [Aethina tumida]
MILKFAIKNFQTVSRKYAAAPPTGVKAFTESCIVPDMLDCPPEKELTVTYSCGRKVTLGNILTPTLVKDPPELCWDADKCKFYTALMADPDAPSRRCPHSREFQHWLVGNIPGKEIGKGETLSEYIGAGPPPNSGLHRYVILVFQQPDKIEFCEKKLNNKSKDGREKFSTLGFAEKYSLGKPLYGNFFQAEWDDYVPTLYKQLGIQE